MLKIGMTVIIHMGPSKILPTKISSSSSRRVLGIYEAAHKEEQVSFKAVKESPPLPDDIKTKIIAWDGRDSSLTVSC